MIDAYEDQEGKAAATLRTLVDFRDKRVLEIGCGQGRLTRRYAGETAHVTAIDPAAEKIAKAREQTPPDLAARIHYLVAAIETYEHPPAQPRFDAAIFGYSL